MATPAPPPGKHGLSFLATLAFVAGFFGARIFHLAFPETMVFIGVIHLHHFWYGLAMMGVAGWLGIAENDARYNRIYAVVFGVGAGFVGDEVGLLLTFGDYYSTLTDDFFVAAVAAIILIALFLRYRKEIERDVLRAGMREGLVLLGIFLAAFSTIVIGYPVVGIPILIGGILLAVWGLVLRRRKTDGSPVSRRTS